MVCPFVELIHTFVHAQPFATNGDQMKSNVISAFVMTTITARDRMTFSRKVSSTPFNPQTVLQA
jgi:hypothetical protein